MWDATKWLIVNVVPKISKIAFVLIWKMIIFWQRNKKAFIFYDESEGTSMYKCVYGHHVDEVVHFALGALVCV